MMEFRARPLTPLKPFSGDTGNVIAFDPASGRTHFLSELAWVVFLAIRDHGPRPADDRLRRDVAAAFGVEPDDLTTDDLTRIVDELDALGLILPTVPS